MATNIDIQGTPISRLPRETRPDGVDVSGVKSGRTVKVSLDLLATKDDINNIDNNRKGYFSTDTELKAAYPKPKTGYYAYVGSTGTIWKEAGDVWVDSGKLIPHDVDFSNVATKQELVQLAGNLMLSENYEMLIPEYDEYGNVTESTVKWFDGTSGVLTYSDFNDMFLCFDSYQITYNNIAVIQPKVTRDEIGNIINSPSKIIQ